MNSNKYYRIAIFVLIGLLVMSIGALAGWYVVLRQRGQTITWQDAARGFGFGTPIGNPNGSNFDNLGVGGGGGGGFAIGGAPGADLLGGSGTDGTGGEFGGSGNPGIGTGNTDTTTTGGRTGSSPIVYKTPRLWRATKTPVAGFEFSTTTAMVYFAERATGYIFRVDAASGEILRRTNTLLPKTYEAHFARDGTAIYRSVHENSGALLTFVGAIGSSSSPTVGTFTGVNLRNNLFAFDANPDSRKIFYMAEESGKFNGYTQDWLPGRNSQATRVFSSNIASWRLFALADGRLIISEKPQDGALGYAYEIGIEGRLTPLVRAAPGLTILPLSGNRTILFGTSAGGLTLYAQTGTTTLALPIKTVADKCVWAPYSRSSDLVAYCAVPTQISSQNFLRDWYMGAIHTSDSWWRVNLTNGETEQILPAQNDGVAIDVVDPAIDPTGTMLGFKNGVDGSLWVLRIVR